MFFPYSSLSIWKLFSRHAVTIFLYDCGIPAADGLENSSQIDINQKMITGPLMRQQFIDNFIGQSKGYTHPDLAGY